MVGAVFNRDLLGLAYTLSGEKSMGSCWSFVISWGLIEKSGFW
jgi:hypothetical protein